jgi:sialate O-acetylesterase
MKYTSHRVLLSKTMSLLAFMFLVGVSPVLADVSLPSVLSDHMVLQRDKPIPVWGKADPGETVTVSIGEQHATTTADQAGRWRVDLNPMSAGGPVTMTVAGSNTLTLEDIYIGEVWLCTGQSNMQWTVNNSADPKVEVAQADWPMIRMYTAVHTLSAEPQDDVVGSWQVSSPETVGEFSAVGYYFGRELHRELNVPIGLVHSSLGGSGAEPWTPRETLLSHPKYAPAIESIDRDLAAYKADMDRMDGQYAEALKAFQVETAAWREHMTDGGRGVEEKWQSADLAEDDWLAIDVPGAWEATGGDALKSFDGVVWFRLTVDFPTAWSGKDLVLNLGAIDDVDIVYVNGEQIGRTGFDTPNYWSTPRRYVIPGEQVREGEMTIAVRVLDTGHGGGFTGKPEQLTLVPGEDTDAVPISLAGSWRYRMDFSLADMPAAVTAPQDPATIGKSFTSPAAMYNGMLHPLVPYALRGAIWYQGESNAGRAEAYRELLPLMIRGWRDVWAQPDMAFGIVQLANFWQTVDEPVDSGWAELRDAQLHTLKTTAHTGLAVAIDIGNATDIHPKNKQEVGRRLSLWALSQVYGQDLVWSGPIYQSMRVEGGKISLSFDHVGGGLQVRDGGSLRSFSIAGEDRRFVWAQAEIVGDEVVVWSDQVTSPVAVRYGWADNPDKANFINQEGLPASPFRTDDWPGITAGK